MKVRFGEIPEEGLRYEISDESWFPDHELQRTGPVRSEILLKRDGAVRVLLTGRIKTTVGLDCDRCAENFNLELDDSFKLDLEYTADRPTSQAEHECSSSEMDMVYLQEPVIDLYEILAQQIYLMVPDKSLCSEACKGLCPMCGTNLNQEICDCKKELKTSPFSVLKK
jgi:uncharacterized protein